MQQHIIESNLRICEFYPLTNTGWISNIERISRGCFYDKPVVFMPGKDFFVHESTGFLSFRMPDGEDSFYIRKTDGGGAWRTPTLSNSIPLGWDGMPVDDFSKCGYIGNKNADYKAVALKPLRDKRDSNKRYALYCLTGLDPKKGGLILIHKPTLKVKVINFRCHKATFSEDGATLICWRKNVVTILDNPFVVE